jgi:segregation and condensation protein A
VTEPADGAADQNPPEDFVSKVPWPVRVGTFEGPLDLLLFLIRENKMDIFSVNLTEITEGFLQYVQLTQKLDLELAGEFLVVASLLIQFKTRALLPQELPQDEEEEEDDAELILRKLEEYERFKEVATILREKEEDWHARYKRVGGAEEYEKGVELVLVELDIYDLYSAFKKVLAEIGRDQPYVVRSQTFTVDEKIAELRGLLEETPRVNLMEHLRKMQSKVEVIVTFLALLEVVRIGVARVRQALQTGEIWLLRMEDIP